MLPRSGTTLIYWHFMTVVCNTNLITSTTKWIVKNRWLSSLPCDQYSLASFVATFDADLSLLPLQTSTEAVYVRENDHIAFLIDLEWACSLPIEVQHPPHWLTGRNVDQLVGEHLADFDDIRKEFMTIFEN